MSEEKRFIKNKKIFALSMSLVAVLVLAGVLGGSIILITDNYNDLSGDYDNLYGEYNDLLNSFDELENLYFILTGEHIELEDDYGELLNAYNTLNSTYNELSNDYDILESAYNVLQLEYDALLIAYNYITAAIRQTILPIQYSVFTEAVRRYYMPIYLSVSTTKEWYMGYAEFCRDMVLHDSEQYNTFSEVSDAFSDALRYGSNTMYLADYIMYWTFYDWLPYWGLNLTFDELWGIDTIVDWCINEIDYEYDSDITDGQEDPTWDYPKFPVETAFRTMGDCEDQAILASAYLESCGFETAISIFHDPSHPTYGAFYHGVPLVHIEDTSIFWSNYPSCSLWRLGSGDLYYPEYIWCYLDPTWDVPFGSTPSWLQDYIDIGSISWDIHSTAFCDIDGVVQENLGLAYNIPDQ